MVNITKLLVIVIVFATALHAKPIKYTATFDDVKVMYPAVSTKTTCTIKVDLNDGLVNNLTSCDVNEISVYNKDSMWLGNLDGISAYGDARYQDYDTERYQGKGKYIRADYVFESEDASESNAWRISCPKGMIKYIETDIEWGPAYTCKTPYKCGPIGYATDSITCERLPDNAHRNKTTGFTCNKGYVWHDGYCEEKSHCKKDEIYDETTNSCRIHPKFAHWVNEIDYEWECDDGYVVQNNTCEKQMTCDSASRYYADNNTCVTLPEFAYWNDSISTEWSCNHGYVLYGGECVEKATCSSEQRYNEQANSCVDPYPNSRWVGDDGNYVCIDGYVDMDYGNCEKKADCEHYNSATNSCYEKPNNSHWVYSTGSSWACDYGYHESYNECIKCLGDAQYDPSSRECVEKPNNSHWIFEGRWACDDDFVEMNGYCEEKADCGLFEEYNSYNNTCISNPINLTDHVRDFMEYVHFTHDIGMDVGLGSFKDNYDESQVLINIGMDYNIGINIGSDNVKVRLQGSVAFLYTLLDYSTSEYSYTDESIMALLGLYGFNVGIDLWKITLAYSYLFVAQSELDNISFNNALHKIRAGFMLNEHWDAHLSVIPNLIKSTSIMKTYTNTWYHIGMTYRF